MSSRICYRHIAIKYPAAELKAVFDHYTFYEDHYLLLELGGDNNVTMRHPATGREVSERDWSAIAMGTGCDVIKKVVHLSAACEGGCVRLAGARTTTPETYIRRMRETLAGAIHFGHAARYGLQAMAELKGVEPPQYPDFWKDAQKALCQVTGAAEGASSWSLQPLLRIDQAAALMIYQSIDPHEVWNKVRVSGPRFDDVAPRGRRAPAAAAAGQSGMTFQ